MARFCGKVGYGKTEETVPGVHEEVITEYIYRGDVVRNTRKLAEGTEINGDITTGNSISIVADPYAREHFFEIRFVEWAGVLWTVTDVEVQIPRLLLRLGGVYNGSRAKAPTA